MGEINQKSLKNSQKLFNQYSHTQIYSKTSNQLTKKLSSDLESARKTSILSGTKTNATENNMQEWLSRIQEIIRPNPVHLKRLEVKTPLFFEPIKLIKSEAASSDLALSTEKPQAFHETSDLLIKLKEKPLDTQTSVKKDSFIKVGPLRNLSIIKGDQDISFPTSHQIKKHLLQNRGSFIVSHTTWTDFHMSTVFGSLNNFYSTPDYGDFTVNLKFSRFIPENTMSSFHKKGTQVKYHLQGIFSINFENSKIPLTIFMKSYTAYPYFITQGLVEETIGRTKVITKIDRIRVSRRF